MKVKTTVHYDYYDTVTKCTIQYSAEFPISQSLSTTFSMENNNDRTIHRDSIMLWGKSVAISKCSPADDYDVTKGEDVSRIKAQKKMYKQISSQFKAMYKKYNAAVSFIYQSLEELEDRTAYRTEKLASY